MSLVVTALVSGCTKPNPKSCRDGTCTDPALPFCDVDGALSGEPETCIAVSCTPGEFEACRGDLAITCNTAGTSYDLIHCERGCDDALGGCRTCTPNETACVNGAVVSCDANGVPSTIEQCALGCFEAEPRCREIDPSNGVAPDLSLSETAPELDYPYLTIDTDQGTVSGPNVTIELPTLLAPNPGGPQQIRVFFTRKATLHHVTVYGSRPLAIVSKDEIVVTGPMRVQAGSAPSTLSACDAGNGNAFISYFPGGESSSGSGGGGHATAGGDGGSIPNRPGGKGGMANGSETLVPLRGGCPSGAIRWMDADGGSGIATDYLTDGGGALQLVSTAGIRVEGVIDVRGASGYFEGAPGVAYAYGGGAGGGILLEAPRVVLGATAALIAKGGGGGAAGPLPAGDDSGEPQPGAVCQATGCSSGGAGASASTPAGSAMDLTNTGVAGGGGGGLGYVRVNTASGIYEKQSSTIEAARVTTGTIATR